MAVAFQSRIGPVAVGEQGGTRGDVRLDEGVNVDGFVARYGGETDAARQSVEVAGTVPLGFVRLSCGVVDHLDSPDDKNLAALERTVGVGVGSQRHFGLVDLDDTFQRITVRIDHGAP